jgi:hypothetical protein
LIVKIDWKSLAIIVGLLGGAVGSGFNTFMDWLRENRTERVQESSYELLATRLEELSQKVTMLELRLTEEFAFEGPPEPEPEPRPRAIRHSRPRPHILESVEIEGDIFESEPEEEVAEVELIEEPANVAYQNARLPDFDQIQQMAQEEEGLEEFVEEVKNR